MSTVPDKIQTWQMVQPTSKNKETGEVKPGKLEKTSIPVPTLAGDEVLVKVAGRGGKSLCGPEDAGKQPGGVGGVLKPYSSSLHRPLRGEKPGQYSSGTFS